MPADLTNREILIGLSDHNTAITGHHHALARGANILWRIHHFEKGTWDTRGAFDTRNIVKFFLSIRGTVYVPLSSVKWCAKRKKCQP